MKKLFAILLACVMLLNMGAAMAEEETETTSAYAPVQVPGLTTSYPHTLELTGEITSLNYDIPYSFSFSSNPLTIMQPEGIVNTDMAVTGTPRITTQEIKYTSEDDFSADNASLTKYFTVDWSTVYFKEPGVYRWTVEKTVVDNDPTENEPSNNSSVFYLFVFVTDNADALKVESYGLTSRANLDTAPDGAIDVKGALNDQYPSALVDLSVGKIVTGDQGSKNKYFAFNINLKAPTGSNAEDYNITYKNGSKDWDGSYEATAYNASSGTNPNSVRVSATGTTFTLYLKHGQTASIVGLPYNTSYTITEVPSGYTVKEIVASGDSPTTVDKGAAKASDTSLSQDTSVTFTNEKIAITPTGIDLQTGAPIMGLLLAASMLLMLFISKRREAAE